MRDKKLSFLRVGERKIPLKAIEKLEQIINAWIKNKERAREISINQISESMTVIEHSGGSVVWEIDGVDK